MSKGINSLPIVDHENRPQFSGDVTLPDVIEIVWKDADGNVTGISALDTRCGEMADYGTDWYTVDGRKLDGKPATKGLYINNGRKVVVK